VDKPSEKQQFYKLQLLCEKVRAVALAQPGLLTAGWLAVKQNSIKFRNFEII